jgi:hypothetical protein
VVDRNMLITAGNTTIVKRVVLGQPAENATIVKKVVVGRPVRRIQEQSLDFEQVKGLDFTGKTNGSVLVYNSSTELWEATLDLEEQNINGGSY